MNNRIPLTITSFSFILFMAVALLLFRLFEKRGQTYFVCAASLCFFLFSSGWRTLPLLVYSAAAAYIGGILIEKRQTKRRLCIAVAFILLPLVVLRTARGAFVSITPIGISFYSLSVITYLVNVFRGVEPAQKDFGKLTLFTSYFPTLTSGPILEYHKIKEQLFSHHAILVENLLAGTLRMLWGTFKKLVIAERLAVIVNTVYGDYVQYSGVLIIVATVCYAFQLYMDFSGCMDIVIGASKCFDIQLPENFSTPYFARSTKEFWARWHISLSSWLRDYVYIPLGGNRYGKIRTSVNLMVTFLISGIWHGAGWHFVFWGALHGAYQVLGRYIKPFKERLYIKVSLSPDTPVIRLAERIVTFILVDFAWLFFRAPSLRDAFALIANVGNGFALHKLWDGTLLTLGLAKEDMIVMLLGLLTVFLVSSGVYKKGEEQVRAAICNANVVFRYIVWLGLIFSILVFGKYGAGYNASTFIYQAF